jgi:hypothetical protein
MTHHQGPVKLGLPKTWSRLDQTPMSPLPVSTVFVALTFGAAWVAWLAIFFGAMLKRVVTGKSEEAEEEDAIELGEDSVDEEEKEALTSSTTTKSTKVVEVAAETKSAHSAVIVLPLEATLPSIEAMLRDWSQLGLIFLYCWLNEYMPLFPRSSKSPNLDHFWFVTSIFFLCAATSFKPAKDNGLLNRLQTEEWKGWMQFIFLAYHYYHQSETYNAVRVFISCYVWIRALVTFPSST